MPPQHWHRLIPRAWFETWKNTSTAAMAWVSLCWLATLTTPQINNTSDPGGSLVCINVFICRAMFNFVNCVTLSGVQSILNLPWWRSVPRTVRATLGQSRGMRITDQYKDNSTGPRSINAQDVRRLYHHGWHRLSRLTSTGRAAKPQVHHRAWGFFIITRTRMRLVISNSTLFLMSRVCLLSVL